MEQSFHLPRLEQSIQHSGFGHPLDFHVDHTDIVIEGFALGKLVNLNSCT